jgi:hypothetical protein
MKNLLLGFMILASLSVCAETCNGLDKANNLVDVKIDKSDSEYCISDQETYSISVMVNDVEEYSAQCAIFSEKNNSFSTGDLQFYLYNVSNETSNLYLKTDMRIYNTVEIECK